MVNEKMKFLGESPSVIRDLYEKANALKELYGEDNVFDFSIGNPSIPTPNYVTNTLKTLLDETDPVKLHGYTPSVGDKETRLSISSYINKKYGVNENPDLIYITMGAAAGLTISLNALLNPNDEAIIFSPYFPEYKVFIEKALGIVKEVKTDKNFMIDLELLDKAINKNTRLIIIDSPNNPTGVLYPESLIIDLSNLLKRKEKEYNHPIFILSDEPYRELIYTDDDYPFITKYYDDSIVIYSFSKSLSLPGERIGYIIVSNKCANKENVFNAIKGAGRALGFICASSMYQKLIPKVLGITSDINEYKKNRDKLMEILDELGYEYAKPSGAFYLYMKALEDDAISFSNKALKHNLVIVPSDSFGSTGYVRISYCVKYETITKSYDAFKALKEEYEAKNEWH